MSEHYTPSVTSNNDGSLTLHWPDGTPNTCIVSKALAVEVVSQLSHIHALCARHDIDIDGIVRLVDWMLNVDSAVVRDDETVGFYCRLARGES